MLSDTSSERKKRTKVTTKDLFAAATPHDDPTGQEVDQDSGSHFDELNGVFSRTVTADKVGN